jgi:hypothetical protein
MHTHTYIHTHIQTYFHTQIADDYFKLKKFNIHELTGQGQQEREKGSKAPKAESHFEGGRVVKDKEADKAEVKDKEGDKPKAEAKEDAEKAKEEKKEEKEEKEEEK